MGEQGDQDEDTQVEVLIDQWKVEGFNRSQHPDSGGGNEQAGRPDERGDWRACDEIAREAVIAAGHRAGVLA